MTLSWVCFMRCLAPEGYVYWTRLEFPRSQYDPREAAQKAIECQAGSSGIVEEVEVFGSGLGTRESWRVDREALPETHYRFSLGQKL